VASGMDEVTRSFVFGSLSFHTSDRGYS